MLNYKYVFIFIDTSIDKFNYKTSLILATKTRWNSLVNMLKIFQALKDQIMKSMIGLNKLYNFTDYDFEVLEKLFKFLVPFELALNKLNELNLSY